MMTRRGGRREDGYALVAAVAAILLFALVSLAVLSRTQRAVESGRVELDEARAYAAADAGVALAVRALLADGPGNAFPIDGSVRRFRFEGAEIAIVVEDERGKVPLNLLDDSQMTALLESVGLAGDPLLIARDSLLDWIDEDDEVRPSGAERGHYRSLGLEPRNNALLTLGELGRVRGFSPVVVQRIAAVATTDFGFGSFDVRNATPAAIRIMYPQGDAAIDEIVRARAARGQVAALDFADSKARVGRPLTIVATALLPAGAVGRRKCVVELTGAERRPIVLRYCI